VACILDRTANESSTLEICAHGYIIYILMTKLTTMSEGLFLSVVYRSKEVYWISLLFDIEYP
jgi:hypothetical protein